MNYEVIATGSNGNALILADTVLIDCGVTYKALESRVKDLKLVLLSHVHGDHFKPATLRRLSTERPTLRFVACEWLVNPLINASVPARNIDVLVPGEWYHYGSVTLSPFKLFHDVENCGYKINIDGQKVIYATDTGSMDGVEAKGFDWYFLEANHEKEDITARAEAKIARGEYAYELRAAQNHLSREQAEDWLYQNMGPCSRYVFLHGHKEVKHELK